MINRRKPDGNSTTAANQRLRKTLSRIIYPCVWHKLENLCSTTCDKNSKRTRVYCYDSRPGAVYINQTSRLFIVPRNLSDDTDIVLYNNNDNSSYDRLFCSKSKRFFFLLLNVLTVDA